MHQEIIQTVRLGALFKGMSDMEIDDVITSLNGYIRKYRKNEILLHAGSHTDQIGVVLSGTLFVEVNDLWGSRTILHRVHECGYFAEVFALIPGSRSPVDVRAETDCDILYLQIGNLPDDIRRKNAVQLLRENLLEISISMNLAQTTRSLHTSPRTIRGKVLAYLNTCAFRNHSKEFEIPFNRQQLADYLCIDRSALSRELALMQKEGIIRFHSNHFLILDQ